VRGRKHQSGPQRGCELEESGSDFSITHAYEDRFYPLALPCAATALTAASIAAASPR
jgi:hypothetical protein